jgi:hypothetical protein
MSFRVNLRGKALKTSRKKKRGLLKIAGGGVLSAIDWIGRYQVVHALHIESWINTHAVIRNLPLWIGLTAIAFGAFQYFEVGRFFKPHAAPIPPWLLPPKYEPVAHECAKAKPEPGEALRLLAIISHYEAAHVLCPGPIWSRCPNCGKPGEPSVHPTIELLKHQFPAETKDWNPLTKGFMLCDECSRSLKA